MARGGRRYHAGRPARRVRAEECRSIDVRRFNREGMLLPGDWSWGWYDAITSERRASIGVRASPGYVVLTYSIGGQDVAERVGITYTACALGGDRSWFSCPRCHGRVAILYLSGTRFACRQCHGLLYNSQVGSAWSAAIDKLHRLEGRLGPGWSRPKGMHYRTCIQLQKRALKAAQLADSLIAAQTWALMDHLDSMGLGDGSAKAWRASRQCD